MKPIILIPAQRTSGEEEDGCASACRQAYLDSISKAGGVPLIVPLGLNESDWEQAYQLSSGIFLTGGSDVDPKLYGEEPHPKLGKLVPERDIMECWFVKRAFADDKPLLGICRGLQVMNVALGGSLYQDIADQFGGKIAHSSSSKGPDRWEVLSHSLEINIDSHFATIMPEPFCSINSLHHQAIKDLAPGLNIAAKAPDGIIEAIEGDGKRFFMGIQSHPEALWQKVDPRWLKLFLEFVSKCKKAR